MRLPRTFAGIGIFVLNVPQTALDPRLERKWPFATTLPVESRTRHTTFASKTRAEPVSVRGAPEFPIDQMARIDRNVLRIALYELRVSGDAPAGVVIDEAVELAKMFGSEASPKFVNGVLATAVGGPKERST